MEKKYSGAPGMVSPTYTTYPTTQQMGGMYPHMGGVYPGAGGGYGYPGSAGQTTTCPTNVAPTTTMPAVVSPTKQVIQPNVYKHIVPHVHPTHKTTVNQHVFQHQHYFPYTKSVVNQCCSQQVFCGMPPCPCSGRRGYY